MRRSLYRLRLMAGSIFVALAVGQCLLHADPAAVAAGPCRFPGENSSAAWPSAALAAKERVLKEPAARQAATAAEEWRRLDREFPVESDWFLQDLGARRLEWLRGGDLIKPAMEQVLMELGAVGDACRQEMAGLAAVPAGDPRWLELYARAAGQRRLLRLKTVQEQAPKIVFAKHFNLGGSHYAYTEAQSDAQSERYYRLGASLCRLELRQGVATVRTLLDDSDGIIRDPQPDWNAQKLLFAWKKSDRLDDYHLYEMNLEDARIRQLTGGLGVADYEGAYLPDGGIVFASTRCVQTVDCWWTEVSNLYACDADGRRLRRLGFDQVHTNYPQVLDDGRVTYTRWEYNDRGQLFPQPLFQMNPDGTGQTEFYGNNSWFPTSILHARGIPGTGQVAAILSGHHSDQSGKLAVIDPAKGRQENLGVQLVAPVRATPADHIDAYGQQGDQWMHPWPLNAREFLVGFWPDDGARLPRKGRLDGWFRIFWMDRDGHRELLAADPAASCDQPVVLAPRQPPAMRPSGVDPRRTTGIYYIQDVYLGPGLQGVPRGTAREIRVVTLDFRAAGIGSNGNRGAAGSALVSTPVAISNGTWDPKTILGTVPIQADGSAMFEVPARTPVYFQVLDADRQVIQTMRSWSTLQPGETFSCVGCHENKNETPPANLGFSLAMKAGPVKLTPFYGPPRGFSFVREIQPILDRHCITCHDQRAAPGSKFPEGKAFSLKGDTTPDAHAKRSWSDAYLALTGVAYTPAAPGFAGRPFAVPATGVRSPLVNWHDIQSAPPMLPPYAAGSAKSGLLAMLRKGHKKVELSREELDKLAAWIDLLVPYGGDYVEGNCWTAAETAKYNHFLAKRQALADLEGRQDPWPGAGPGTATVLAEDGRLSVVDIPAAPQVEPRRRPALNGDLDAYRNLACNPLDRADGRSFPHATASSVCRNEAPFAARHAIDGQLKNRGHGGWPFQSWGPDVKPNLWWQVDFGRPVQIDKVVVALRADFPHDGTWRKAVLRFSDGSSLAISLAATAAPQPFRLNRVVKTTFVRFEPADPQPKPSSWCALTELEAWGRDLIDIGADPVKSAPVVAEIGQAKESEIVSTARRQPAIWRWTTAAPVPGWEKPGFDDHAWQEGKAGFGTIGTPGTFIGSTWNTHDIWIRRSCRLPEIFKGEMNFIIHHDEDTEIFIDGIPAAQVTGHTIDYEAIEIAPAARGKLRPGAEIVLAVHCHQTTGGQYIDVGIQLLPDSGIPPKRQK